MKSILSVLMSVALLSTSVALATPEKEVFSRTEIINMLNEAKSDTVNTVQLDLIDQAILKVEVASNQELEELNTALLQNTEVAYYYSDYSVAGICNTPITATVCIALIIAIAVSL